MIDTNVFFSAFYSRRGASFKLLSLIGENKFDINISVALLFEYEDVAKRNDMLTVSDENVDKILNYICLVGKRTEIFYLWRPQLKDPKDDFVLELAANSGSDSIITYNKKDFINVAGKFSIDVLSLYEFLKGIGEIKWVP